MIIRVAATSANIGPGFDSFAIAFNLYNEFEFKRQTPGESAQDNLILKSFRYYFEKLGLEPIEVSVNVIANVPMSRGLGSSATCIVAGLMAANIYSGEKLNKNDLLEMASEIEGHPDNVAAAIFGGHTIAYGKNILKLEVSDKLQFHAIIPDFEMSTEESRKAVPSEISVKDAVENIAGASFITNALRIGDFNLLKNAPHDRIHEKKRLENLKGFDEVEKIFGDNAKIFLSGSGSTLLLISEKGTDFSKEFDELYKLEPNWQIVNLKVDNFGARRIDQIV